MNDDLIEKEQKLKNDMKNSKIKILNVEESLKEIITKKKSICRFGDGEMFIILAKKGLGYQKYTPELSQKLKSILMQKQDFCFVGIPDAINTFENITDESKAFWVNNMYEYRNNWVELLNPEMEYLTANITRLYIRYKDKSNCGKYFELLKSIWRNRDVVICEGDKTRMGVGNNLLDECKSVKRIICPAENAFDKYEIILERLKKENKNSLFLIALGPTATILAYELSKDGFQALDIGHFDIEYEWFLRQANSKEKIENKYTNEVVGGNLTNDLKDEKYLKQIKEIIK